MKIKMLITVVPDMPMIFFCKPETRLIRGQTYQATANKNGTILGVKPDEFEFVEDTQNEYLRAGKNNGM